MGGLWGLESEQGGQEEAKTRRGQSEGEAKAKARRRQGEDKAKARPRGGGEASLPLGHFGPGVVRGRLGSISPFAFEAFRLSLSLSRLCLVFVLPLLRPFEC